MQGKTQNRVCMWELKGRILAAGRLQKLTQSVYFILFFKYMSVVHYHNLTLSHDGWLWNQLSNFSFFHLGIVPTPKRGMVSYWNEKQPSTYVGTVKKENQKSHIKLSYWILEHKKTHWYTNRLPSLTVEELTAWKKQERQRKRNVSTADGVVFVLHVFSWVYCKYIHI